VKRLSESASIIVRFALYLIPNIPRRAERLRYRDDLMKRVVVPIACALVVACTSNPPTPQPTVAPTALVSPAPTASPAAHPTIAFPSATPSATASVEQSTPPAASSSPSAHVVEVLVGGGSAPVTERADASDVLLKQPSGIAVGSVGDSTVQGSGNIYITDSSLGIEFRTWTGGGQTIDVLHGMAAPEGLTIGEQGMGPGYPFIADPGNNVVVIPGPNFGVTPFAGDGTNPGFGGDGGPAEKASLLQPHDVTTGPGSNCSYYIADTGNNRIRIVEPTRTCESQWVINTVAGDGHPGFRGDGGTAIDSEMNGPEAILVDGGGLLIADSGNHRIRLMGMGNGDINTIVGNGDADPVPYTAGLGPLDMPIGNIAAIAVDLIGGVYFPVTWSDIGLTIMRLDPYGGLELVAGGGTSLAPGVDALDFQLPDVLSLAIDQYDGALLIGGADGKVYRIPGIAPG
jgi:hypothetical protein